MKREFLVAFICIPALTGCYNVILINVGANHTAAMQGKLPPSEMCAAALLLDEHAKPNQAQLKICNAMAAREAKK